MPHLTTLQFFALSVYAVLMAAAAIEDFRRLIIPNLVPALLCAAWPLYFAATHDVVGGPGAAAREVLASLGVAFAVFLVGAVLFARGWLGGGDVKLLAAAALWSGPAGLPQLLMLTGVIGGGLALFLLNPAGRCLASGARALIGGGVPATESALQTPVPYGLAIAGAALIAVVLPYLG
jgi:prepilin peptidase CpaA